VQRWDPSTFRIRSHLSGPHLTPSNGRPTQGQGGQGFRCQEPFPTEILLDRVALWVQHTAMGRPRRTQVGGLVYHVPNRANGRTQIFGHAGDYLAFLRSLADAQTEHPMRLLFYCVLANHS